MSENRGWEEEAVREQEGEDAPQQDSHCDGHADCDSRFGERLSRVSHQEHISAASHWKRRGALQMVIRRSDKGLIRRHFWSCE